MDYTINTFRKQFCSDDACLEYIFQKKYAGKECPKCKRIGTYYRVRMRKCFACSFCAHQLHPTAGTIFEKSSTSLQNWFYALFLFSMSKNGISAKELERQIGVTYKTAWRMAKEIRKLMSETIPPSKGTFEADETFLKDRSKTRYRGKNVSTIMNVVKRDGGVVSQQVQDNSKFSVMPVIEEVAERGSVLYTDKATMYAEAKDLYKHEALNHSKKEYARGKAHTNNLEGFWSHFKRSIFGTYCYVSEKYLQSYLNEFSFRYNHRNGQVFSLLLKKMVQ